MRILGIADRSVMVRGPPSRRICGCSDEYVLCAEFSFIRAAVLYVRNPACSCRPAWARYPRRRWACAPPRSGVASLQFDEPQDDVAVALAGPAHGPHAVDHSRLDLDEHWP